MHTYFGPYTEIVPYVRFAGRSPFPAPYTSPIRVAYDHRLIYTHSGTATLQLENQDVILHAGDVVLVHSGMPYAFMTAAVSVVFTIANFDFFPGYENHASMPLPMTSPEGFRPEQQHEQVRFSDFDFDSGVYLSSGAFDLMPYMEALENEYNRTELLYTRQLQALLLYSLNCIYRSSKRMIPHHGRNEHADILAFITQHFAEPLTNRSIANQFHYHPNYVNQLVRTQTGRSLHQYLLRLRILRATDLLLSSNMPIGDIARQTGFSDPNYFAQYFRRCYGCSPSAFRGGTAKPSNESFEKWYSV